jgi:hypothetical protein
MRRELLERLSRLVGRDVFFVYGGPSTGSVLDIDFTPVKARAKPLANPSLPEICRQQMGTSSLFIECSWRLQVRGKVISGSGDTFENGDSALAAVRTLVGQSVTHVLTPGGEEVLDLAIGFRDGSDLRVFCDSGVSDAQDYCFFDENGVISVRSGCVVTEGEGAEAGGDMGSPRKGDATQF